MIMTRISTQTSRRLFPIVALTLGALVFAASPVSVGSSGLQFQQAYAKGSSAGGSDRGGAESGSADRGADKGSAEGSSADRGADTGSADTGGATGAAGTNGGSRDAAGHDAQDR
jgi:hypothetical protein